MDEVKTNIEWKYDALDSQRYADNLRANPRKWFRYYYERVICVFILMAISVAGFLALVQLLLVGHSG